MQKNIKLTECLDNLIESTPIGVTIVDSKGSIVSLNKKAGEIFGLKQKKISDKSLTSIFSSIQKEKLKEFISRCFSSSRQVTEIFDRKTKKNKQQFLEVVGMRMDSNKNKKQVMLIIQDISLRIIAEREHRIDHERVKKVLKSEKNQRVKAEEVSKRLSFLTRVSNVLISSLDYETRLQNIADIAVPYLADLCVVDIVEKGVAIDRIAVAYVDSAKKHLVDKLKKQFVPDLNGDHPVAQVFRSGKPIIIPRINKKILKSLSYSFEHFNLIQELDYQSYIVIPLFAHGRILGVISLLMTKSGRYYNRRDLSLAKDLANHAALSVANAILYKSVQDELSERRKIEEELKKSKDQLEIIIQNVEDGIIVRNARGLPVYVNQSLVKMFEYPSIELFLKHSLKELVSKFKITDEFGNPFPPHELPIARAIKGEISPIRTLLFQSIATREKRWLTVRSKPIFDKKGKVQLAVGIVSDITERKQEEMQRDMFIGIASHELRNTLAGIKAFDQILEKRFKNEKDQKAYLYLSKIDERVDKLTKLIADLLDITKIRAGKLDFFNEVFDLNELLKEIVGDLQTVAKQQIIIKGKIKKLVIADKDRIEQLLTNLITNAIKYSKEKGQIIVTTSSDKNQAYVSVQDFGIGIAKEKQTKIFEPYYQVENYDREKSSGLGLGLYLARAIIKHYGGDINVKSEVGKGSNFYFNLPLRNP